MSTYKSIINSTIVAGALLSNTLFAYDEIIEPKGINQIKEIIQQDERLNKKVDITAINESIVSIDRMNTLIKEAIVANGLVNDGNLSIADVREINNYLSQNHLNEWYELRGEKADSSGYYAVERKGARTVALNKNAVNHLWARIYDLGFVSYDKNRLSNVEGRKSTSIREVGTWLSQVMKNDIKELKNEDYEEVKGTTDTSFDEMLDLILADKGLERRVSTGDLREGIRVSDEMNHLIIEAIINEGLGNDKKLTTADIRQINHYLVKNHKEIWIELHGDDENDTETGFHLIQNDGATSRMYADNVVNSIADGIYHLGFPTNRKNRLENEDGNANKSFEKVAWWLDTILRTDLEEGKFVNDSYEEVEGTTGTTFDLIIPAIYNDEGLLLRVSMEDIREGAKSANGMNELIIEAIKETNVASDSYISVDDVKLINQYLVENHSALWAELHGDDENDEETGFHKIQNDGARTVVHNRNLINNLADSMYHLGFYTPYKRNLANEDGKRNASFRTVAYWMNKYLKDDLEKGILK